MSRRNIDRDALKVLYRLKDHGHTAYLVGGSVRDLLLGRRPKDFDVGTSAHPGEIKRLFRNCWIIGRRFRLAHVRFGPKVVEVATFRRHVPAGTESEPPLEAAGAGSEAAAAHRLLPVPATAPPASGPPHERHRQFERDNTFGTPEEDAFRRDFSVNALFYDIASLAVIDYVGGLQDLEARLVRCIGDPDERFVEDPVRMLRAVALAARLDFRIDPPIYEAIERHRVEIARSAPARLLEELYKILRGGFSERIFRCLAEVGLLEHIAPELDRPDTGSGRLWRSLGELDAYRARFEEIPASLTNPILLGSLVVPLGLTQPAQPGARRPHERGDISLGGLPLARRDIERLWRIVAMTERMADAQLPYRTRRRLMFSGDFRDALTWLEIHGDAPEISDEWRTLAATAEGNEGEPGFMRPDRRRRRGRRRRRRRSPNVPPGA